MYWIIDLFVIYKSGFEFSVQQLGKFSSNVGKVNFEGLVHLLGYIKDSKVLWFKYYADMNDAPLSELLRQARNKTDDQLMDISDSNWKHCPITGWSTGV